MTPSILILVLLLVVILIFTTKESFAETSYYYEAAPGARGARLVCMPEANGQASLGIAAAQAATKAFTTCGPLNLAVEPDAPKKQEPVVKAKIATPKMCPCPSKFRPGGSSMQNAPPALTATVQDPSRPVYKPRPGVDLGQPVIAPPIMAPPPGKLAYQQPPIVPTAGLDNRMMRPIMRPYKPRRPKPPKPYRPYKYPKPPRRRRRRIHRPPPPHPPPRRRKPLKKPPKQYVVVTPTKPRPQHPPPKRPTKRMRLDAQVPPVAPV